MKKHLAILAGILLLGTGIGRAQPSARLYTRPVPPSREALQRLHLKQAWRALIPVGGRRDGIFSVQVIGENIVVQTRAGIVAVLRASDGTIQWRRQVGLAYHVGLEVGHNTDTFFVLRDTFLHALSRKTGDKLWEFDLPAPPTASVNADFENLYVAMGKGKLQIYDLPRKKQGDAQPPGDVVHERKFGASKVSSTYGVQGMRMTAIGRYSATTSGGGWLGGPQPEPIWEYRASDRVESPPILTDDVMIVGVIDGSFVVTSKFYRQHPFKFQASHGVAAPLGHIAIRNEKGQMEDFVFFASKNYNLYCLDVLHAKILSRMAGAAPIHLKPEVTTDSVYVVADRNGLYRINRVSGETIWRNQNAVRYVSSNKKFVYAVDSRGHLMVLDRKRGTEHARIDMSGYTMPISNESTDRLYFANTDGQLLCLHDRDYPTALVTKAEAKLRPPEKTLADKDAEEKAKKLARELDPLEKKAKPAAGNKMDKDEDAMEKKDDKKMEKKDGKMMEKKDDKKAEKKDEDK